MWREKIFPEERRTRLEPDGAYEVIVLAAEGRRSDLEAAVRNHASPPFGGGLARARLDLIGAVAAKASGVGLRALAQSEGVARIWIIPHEIFDRYIHIIQGIEYTLKTIPGPGPINLSLGPPAGLLPMPYREDEPLNLATRRAAAEGKIAIFAAGNDGPKPGMLNPWCLAPWVVCVGAADLHGEAVTLWPQSSRGRLGDPTFRLSVVAPGVDILTTHPPNVPKTREMLAAEKRFGFEAKIPSDQRGRYTVVTGTSFATGQVSEAAAQILYFLTKAREAGGEPTDGTEPTVAKFYTHFRLAERDELVRTNRLAGTIKDVEGVVVAIYPLRPEDPNVVKQILLDASLPMAGFGPHEVGSGLITIEHIAKLFGDFGLWKPTILPVKVTN